MGRVPAIALRLRERVNWPSNVRHPFLSAYLKHIFQYYITSEPGIRASTTGIWVNLTVYREPFHLIYGDQKAKIFKKKVKAFDEGKKEEEEEKKETEQAAVEEETAQMQATDVSEHPKAKDPTLDFRKVDLSTSLGKLESRIKSYFAGLETHTIHPLTGEEIHKVRKPLDVYAPLGKGRISHPLEQKLDNPMEALQIYRDVPIHLRLNIIGNPLMDASILAEYVARYLKQDERALPKLHKELLESLGS